MRVKPLSSKAKNRFANIMNGNSTVFVEQRLGDKVFFVSENGRYCAWAKLGGDADWDFILDLST